MSKFKINEVELEYDALDMDTAEKYIPAKQKVYDDMQALSDKKDNVFVGREQCHIIKEFFDSVFGEGTGVAVCGEKDNLRVCAEAYSAMLQEDKRQGEEMKNSEAMAVITGKTK